MEFLYLFMGGLKWAAIILAVLFIAVLSICIYAAIQRRKIPSIHPQVDFAQYRQVAKLALAEVERARTLFGPMYNAHEGFAILHEEFDELKAHVWMNQKRRDLPAMRKEAIQVAAMAIAFAVEVSTEERGRK